MTRKFKNLRKITSRNRNWLSRSSKISKLRIRKEWNQLRPLKLRGRLILLTLRNRDRKKRPKGSLRKTENLKKRQSKIS